MSIEYRLRRADGAYRWVTATGRPIFSDSGVFCGYIGALAETHDRRLAEEELRERDHRKDEFLALLGHELRNPLAALRSATGVLALIGPEDQRRLQRVQDVLTRQTTQMARLIDGLLDVSRIARGRIALDSRLVNLRTILDTVVHDRRARQTSSGPRLDVSLPREPVWVWGDDARLLQVFENLVGNAIKYTRPDGSVIVSVEQGANQAIVRVRDTGIGFEPDALPRLFEPFQQESPGEALHAGGLGLGLALVKGLIELHGGDVSAHSDGPNTGAEFVVSLPLTAAPAQEETSAAMDPVRPMQILVVEDNEDAANMLADLLAMEGHEVMIAGTGAAGVQLLRERGAEVVLCDIGLPGMSGYDVAREVRADPRLHDTSLVALTGYGQPEDKDRATAAGFDLHLTKPIDLSALHDVLLRRASTGWFGGPKTGGGEPSHAH